MTPILDSGQSASPRPSRAAAERPVAGRALAPSRAIPPPLHHRVLVAGSREGPPLLLLHGFTGDRRAWQGFVEAWRRLGNAPGAHHRLPHGRPADLRNIGPRIIALDLPGHGRSPQPEDPAAQTMPGVVSAVLATMDTLGIARAHLLGYSMGGRVALSLALAAPERVTSLGLIGASPGIADDAERAARAAADDALAARLEADGLPAFVDRWMAQPLFASQARLDPAIRARERRRRLEQSPGGLAASLRQLGTGRMPPLWAALEGLAMPCLYLAGAEDAKFLDIGQQMAARSKQVTVVAVPGAGHAVQLERPEAVAAALAAFLAAVAAGSSTAPGAADA